MENDHMMQVAERAIKITSFHSGRTSPFWGKNVAWERQPFFIAQEML